MRFKRFIPLILVFFLLFFCAGPASADKFYPFGGLTGGATGDLDRMPVDRPVDGTRAIVVSDDYVYYYIFDDTGTDAEDSPKFIRPDDYVDGGVWDLVYQSVLAHIVIVMDPAWAYDQESTYRTIPVLTVDDDFPNGFVLHKWEVDYVGGDPTTELDADIMCDTTADYNPAANATVMDVIDTTAGASSASSGFDSGTCANGSKMYVRFGADPTDDNVLIVIEIWGYDDGS